jgi:PAS domain S-box-containing protein
LTSGAGSGFEIPGKPGGETLQDELARFFQYSLDILVILDGDGRVVVVSPSVKHVLGASIEDLMGETVLHRVHPDDQQLARAKARTVLTGGGVTDLELRVAGAGGNWVPMRWSLAPGPNRRIYGIGRDRTEEFRHREARLRQKMAELRLTTALELHDGVLQILTGAAFQIAVARRMIRGDPHRAEEVLTALARSVSAEQQELRLYVDETRGPSPEGFGEAPGLADRIHAMLGRASAIWGLKAAADVRVGDGLSPEMARRLLRIVQEATVNAARHGGARSVSVEVGLDGQEIVLGVVDDGHGFSFRGEYDNAALKAQRLGPVSLKHRVTEAGGTMSIVSSEQGATLSVRIPLQPDDMP